MLLATSSVGGAPSPELLTYEFGGSEFGRRGA